MRESDKPIKISVVVPVYKVEAYLERCVRSLCRQTYKNLEIILVDDGSLTVPAHSAIGWRPRTTALW